MTPYFLGASNPNNANVCVLGTSFNKDIHAYLYMSAVNMLTALFAKNYL